MAIWVFNPAAIPRGLSGRSRRGSVLSCWERNKILRE